MSALVPDLTTDDEPKVCAECGASWGEVLEASVTGQASGYALGVQHGFREGWQAAREASQDARRAAQVARTGVEAVETVRARQRAAERQAAAAAGWSA